MASAKEIRNQIKAIQNTGKITKAMEMVAAAKMKKAQDRVVEARPYSEGIKRVVANLMQSHPEYKHPFLVAKAEVKRVGVILVTTDKGLCGGLNTNMMRELVIQMRARPGVEFEVLGIGRRGPLFMRRLCQIAATSENIPDTPKLQDILGVTTLAMDRFLEGNYDEVWLAGSDYVNTMTQRPTVSTLLPCPIPEKVHGGYWDYLYEPDSKIVLDGLLRSYVESLVYHALLENKACEQSARMVAMKSATDNSKSIVKELRITYNKARQASITKELSEIVSGASATQ